MITVTLYYQNNCPPCEQAQQDLESLQPVIPHHLVRIDVAKDSVLRERYGQDLPVIEVGPYRRRAPFTRQDLQIMLLAAQDRVTQLEKVDQAGYQQQLAQGRTINFSDRLSLWISKHYLAVFSLLLLLYAGLPVLAPVLMKWNQPGPANLIYRMYSPLCHQLTFRSFFLFGQQPYYPRALAGVPGVMTYEELMNSETINLLEARNFVGNATVGYKMALCERDIAIYGMMFFFTVVYAATGRRLRSIPWYFWVVIGMAPMGIDGVSQLPSVGSNLPAWVPLRESTPFLRTLTGGLFGWMTAWYLFPMIEETMRETRRIMQRKFAVAEQVGRER